MTADAAARIRARFPLGEAAVEVWGMDAECWSCGKPGRLVTGVTLTVGTDMSSFSLAEIGELGLSRSLCAGLGPLVEQHRIGWRYGTTRGRVFLANGCAQCGAVLGQYHDFGPWAFREKICAFAVPLDAGWRRAMLEPEDARERARAVLPPDVPTIEP